MCGAKGWRFRLERKLCRFESYHTDQFSNVQTKPDRKDTYSSWNNFWQGETIFWGGSIMVTATACHAVDCEFESRPSRHFYGGIIYGYYTELSTPISEFESRYSRHFYGTIVKWISRRFAKALFWVRIPVVPPFRQCTILVDKSQAQVQCLLSVLWVHSEMDNHATLRT